MKKTKKKGDRRRKKKKAEGEGRRRNKKKKEEIRKMFMCVYLLIYLRKRKSHLFRGHLVLKAHFQHGCRLYVQLTGLTAESGLICRV